MADVESDDKKDNASQGVFPGSIPAEGKEQEDVAEGDKAHFEDRDKKFFDLVKHWANGKCGKIWDFAKLPESTNVAMAIATIVIAVATVFTWNEIRTGGADTKALAEAAIAQTRPWIGIEGDLQNATLHIEPGNPVQISLDFDLTVKNYGHSPAVMPSQPYFMLGTLTKSEPRFWEHDLHEDLCSHIESSQTLETRFRFPFPVFQETEQTRHVYVAYRPLNDNDPPLAQARTRYTHLSGCILYDGTKAGQYRTRVIYRVLYSPDESKSVGRISYYPIQKIQREWLDVF
jgi:hypothetical protein